MESVQEVLENSTIKTLTKKGEEVQVLMLPDGQLDRKLYLKVASALELIGAEWNKTIKGFVASENAPVPLTIGLELLGYEEGDPAKIKQEYQFFPTPRELADELAQWAKLGDGMKVLEPSAGQGAIIDAIERTGVDVEIYWCEKMNLNREILNSRIDLFSIGIDFLQELEFTPNGGFDRIVANPPFAKNQDIKHIMRMYDLLKDGGRLVAMSSYHWTFAEDSESKNFREWLFDLSASVYDVPKGTFSDSGTEIASKIIVLDK